MSAETEELNITYAELKDGDVVVDKSGNRWNVSEVNAGPNGVLFWLGTPAVAHLHHLTKPVDETATVIRPVSHVAQVEALEAESPIQVPVADFVQKAVEENPVDVAAEALGAETVATETAAEADARVRATLTGVPVDLPAFESMTPLEMHSHLYLLHGVYAYDVKVPAELTTFHAETHRAQNGSGVPAARFVAHRHADNHGGVA